MRGRLRRIAAAGWVAAGLAGCAPTPLVMGLVDPERVDAGVRAVAEPNCTLRRRASLPVTMATLPTVPATINGRPARLIVDTGAETSLIKEAAARRLGVTTEYDFARSVGGISQSMQTGDARLDSMSLGGAVLSYPRVLVGPLAVSLRGVEADGLLGASLLGEYDLDIDLPGRRIDLYDRTECEGLRPPWSGKAAELGTTRSLSSHPFFPVSVNGHELTASLDSGAERTVIAARAARQAGIGAATRVPGPAIGAQGVAGEVIPAELHALRNMRVGGVAVRTPVLVTALSLPNDIDALVGADFLLSHRVWLSYGSRKLFVQ